MGCCYSRVERQELVSRCKARKKYMKQFVQARQAFSASHAMYLRSLRTTGSALLQFSTNETSLHLHLQHHLPPPLPSQAPSTPPPPPPPPPPLSSSSDWTSVTASPALPPPPPPPVASGWDFWDPFVAAASSRSVTEEEWEDGSTTMASEVAVTATVNTSASATTAPSSMLSGFSKGGSNGTNGGSGSELAMVVSRNSGKDLGEIIKELDEYFLRTADAGGHVSVLLEVPTHGFSCHNNKGGKVYNYGWSLSPSLWSLGSPSPKMNNGMGIVGSNEQGIGNGSHCSTAERLYAWEKRLFQEVKNAESLKMAHEKKLAQLRKLELRRADYVKTEKTKKEVEKLESQMMVASQAIETTSEEIVKLREAELYPQLLEIIKGLMGMWRSMYETHQVQTHIVQQLKYLNAIPSAQPTSEIHRQATLQLELEVHQWHQSFCNLVKAQRDYIQSLTGWLRLSLFQFNKNPLFKTTQDSRIYKLCEEWHLAMDHIPDKVASEGIKSLLTVIHAIVLQQTEEHKQKKKSDAALKELDKKSGELRSLESKYGPYSVAEKNPVVEKRAKVDILKAKAEEEKNKHEKSVNVTRSMTLNNLQMGLPHVFQAMVGFSSVCMHAFESVYNQAKGMDHEQDVKRLMPK